MLILFVNLPNPKGINVQRDYCGGFGSAFPTRGGAKNNVFPPVFDAYAAAILVKEGFDVRIIDAQAEELSFPQLLQRVKAEKPDVVISRISLPAFDNDAKILGEIKKSVQGVFLVGWGSVCKIAPEMSLTKSNLDIIIRSELEFTIAELAKKLLNNEDLNSVKGISLRNKEKIVHNSNRPLEKNLSTLPFPAYHLLPMEKYVARESYFVPKGSSNKFIPFFTMLASRGCSLNCIYCPYPVIFGPWRGMAPKRVADEMEILTKDYHVKAVWFHDQTFSMLPKQTEKICDEIINRKIDVYWACETRADKLSIPLVKKMKRAGCTRIQVGIETGDPALLETIGKRSSSINVIDESLQVIQNEGVLVEANFMVGLPGESWKTIQNTAKLIKRIRPDDVSVSIVTPYPGTPLFEIAKREGWLITDDWKNFSTSTPVMKLPTFSDKDMKEAQRYLRYLATSNAALKSITIAVKKRQVGFALKNLIQSLPVFGINLYFTVKFKSHFILT